MVIQSLKSYLISYCRKVILFFIIIPPSNYHLSLPLISFSFPPISSAFPRFTSRFHSLFHPVLLFSFSLSFPQFLLSSPRKMFCSSISVGLIFLSLFRSIPAVSMQMALNRMLLSIPSLSTTRTRRNFAV